jgi:hypothetical protein
VAVIGRELCGLVAGALCAQAGRRVMVIDDGDAHGRALGDRMAPIAPSLWRLPSAGPVAQLFEHLRFKADARRVLGDAVGVGVVDDPELRCVFPVSDDARRRELTRALGEDGAQLAARLAAVDATRRHPALAELATLHEDGWFFQARRARRRAAALGDVARVDAADADVAAVCAGAAGATPVVHQLQRFVQWGAKPLPGTLAAAVALANLQYGTLLGGSGLGPRAGLSDMLEAFIVSHGGEVVADRVAEIDCAGKRITGIRTEKKKHEAVPVAVIDATGARDLVDRLPSGRAREKLLAQQGRVVVAAPANSVRWLLPIRVLPRGMPPVLLHLDDAGEVPVCISISMGAPINASGKGSHLDEQLVCVVATAHTKEPAEIEAVLNTLMPFATDACRARDVVDASAACPAYDVKESEHPFGGRRPRTAFKNLVRAGRDLAPIWGMDGELVSAHSVFALVDAMFPRQPKA